MATSEQNEVPPSVGDTAKEVENDSREGNTTVSSAGVKSPSPVSEGEVEPFVQPSSVGDGPKTDLEDSTNQEKRSDANSTKPIEESTGAASPETSHVIADKTSEKQDKCDKSEKRLHKPKGKDGDAHKAKAHDEGRHERRDLHREVEFLRKKLADVTDGATALVEHAQKEKWPPEHIKVVQSKLRSALLSKDIKADDNDALLGSYGDRGSRRRQTRKRRTGNRRTRSETQRRSGSADSEPSSPNSVVDEPNRSSEGPRRGAGGRSAKQLADGGGQQTHPGKTQLGARGGAMPRKRDHLPEGRKGRGRERGWAPKGTGQRKVLDDDRNAGRSGRVEEPDPETEEIRSALRLAVGHHNIVELEAAIAKAKAKNMVYEAELGNRKLHQLKTA